MALTKASDILGLQKAVQEIAVPIDSLSASKVTVDAVGITSTNANAAFEELATKTEYKYVEYDIAHGSTSIGQNASIVVNSSVEIPAGYDIKGYIPLYSGNAYVITTAATKSASGKLDLTITNCVSSAKTTDGNYTGILVLKKSATLSTKKTTKKK